ncbi:hypothetical protein CDD80_4812 [Ophiocordyceps camponoti-rufipedis]|uniref:EKC/KEOPS complex subunit GON7 n=1 Tax=Ophiocordyceps camponoti-rufipedis TaxID=2004952 RepID=A0A2C5YXH7_9HYPO|nr:hypothetical protein CDD80_4812 [Ophiocordyceps camponoti-rufipedis]
MADTSKDASLTATYTSPTNEAFDFARNIPPPASDAVAEKVQYLEALRNAVDETQALVNKELTARMEEDKTREASAGNATTRLDVDEDKEEENYGEEAQDEE